MTEPIRIATAIPLDDDVLAQIRAVSPRVELVPFQFRPPRTGDPGEEHLAEARAALAYAEILFAQTNIPAAVILAAPRLRWYQVTSAGVDRMAKEGLLGGPFTVTNVRGLAAPAMGEYVIAMMLMLAKDLHIAVRDQAERKWSFHWSRELTGKTCGIVGMGAIGRETARRARAMGMRVVATRRRVSPGVTDPDCDAIYPHTALETLLGESDFVVLCMPLTDETRGMIGASQLNAMKATASLINVARGAVVDQEALITALRDGTIRAAALDVVEPEPLPSDSPLWELPNVILTPHISGAVEGYWARAAAIFIRNLHRYIAGEPLEGVVDEVLAY